MNKREQLISEMKETLHSLLDLTGTNKGLVLRTNEFTAKELEGIDFGIEFKLVKDLAEDDKYTQYRKLNLVMFKWIWTFPELKRSFSGRIMK